MREIRSEYKLRNGPEDAISRLTFSQFGELLVSSWDTHVRLFDVNANSLRHRYTHMGVPVLDSLFISPQITCSAGLNGVVATYDFGNETFKPIGQHDKAAKAVEYCPERNIIASGGWDGQLKTWDLRSPGNVNSYDQGDQVYSMSNKDDLVLVATAERKIYVWDLRNMGSPWQVRDSLLKYQTRCIRIFPNKQGYVLSSIEGRVSVEYFDPNPEVQKKKYAFKCHRIKEEGMENIYPVNAISFHAKHSTFATGGSDGFVNMWDGFNKKRLCQFHRYPSGISALAFSACGTMLAIGCSFLHETDPPNPLPEDSIYIRNVTDQETKPK